MAIDESARAAIAGVVARVRAAADAERQRISWARPPGWHVTLKFLGEVAAQRLAAVGHALAFALGRVPRFDVVLRGLVGFPDQNRARVLAVGVEDGGKAAVAARRIDDALVPLGFEREDREFAAHLTVARLRSRGASRFAAEAVRTHGRTEFGTVAIERIGFYESIVGRDGAQYRLIEDFPLPAT